MKQQPRTQGAAAHTRHREVDHPATRADELAPVTPHASERARPERHGARGIGHERRYPERDDRGKREQRAASRDGVHRAGPEGRHQRECPAEDRHADSVRFRHL